MTLNRTKNILDYMEWRGDLPFERDDINDVDLMILAELSYTKMEDLFQAEEALTIEELCRRYDEAQYDQSEVGYDPGPALRKAAACERYQKILVKDYKNFVVKDKSIQFSAVTFVPDLETEIICFRGTDSTLTGWREDFNFSTDLVTPAQACAVDYLNKRSSGKKLIVCGHSKGGNLAVFSSAFCEPQIQNQIQAIRSFDGPGFHEEILRKEAYQNIMGRSLLYLPEESVFGLLLKQDSPRCIITSSASGFKQHNLYTWCIAGKQFVKADGLADRAKVLDEVIDQWLAKITIEQRREFIDLLFTTMETSGYTRVSELDDHLFDTMKNVMKQLQNTDSAELKKAGRILYELMATSGSYMYTDFVEKLRNIVPQKKEEETLPAAES